MTRHRNQKPLKKNLLKSLILSHLQQFSDHEFKVTGQSNTPKNSVKKSKNIKKPDNIKKSNNMKKLNSAKKPNVRG